MLEVVAGTWMAVERVARNGQDPTVWDATPAFVTEVAPLGTGQGILRLGFVAALHPMAPARQQLDLKVFARTPDCLVGSRAAGDDAGAVHLIAPVSFGWMRHRCAGLWRAFPADKTSGWRAENWGRPFDTVTAYLEALFGANEGDILTRTTADSFGCAKLAMPDQQSRIRIDRTYDAFESYLIQRGAVPRQMEDKWFIYLEDGHLLIRRSWTGNLIYAVEAAWRGDRLHLAAATVNRDPEKYKSTDDAHDRRMLLHLIDGLLLQRRS